MVSVPAIISHYVIATARPRAARRAGADRPRSGTGGHLGMPSDAAAVTDSQELLMLRAQRSTVDCHLCLVFVAAWCLLRRIQYSGRYCSSLRRSGVVSHTGEMQTE